MKVSIMRLCCRHSVNDVLRQIYCEGLTREAVKGEVCGNSRLSFCSWCDSVDHCSVS